MGPEKGGIESEKRKKEKKGRAAAGTTWGTERFASYVDDVTLFVDDSCSVTQTRWSYDYDYSNSSFYLAVDVAVVASSDVR